MDLISATASGDGGFGRGGEERECGGAYLTAAVAAPKESAAAAASRGGAAASSRRPPPCRPISRPTSCFSSFRLAARVNRQIYWMNLYLPNG
uniref:p0028E10.13 protein n=1 Tax=Oryza sativa subsp. japonica TaxID=39947 RepID=Q9AS79_ORYSJ|nr:P0028E10.13 [Oryza sativa Japonica Group]